MNIFNQWTWHKGECSFVAKLRDKDQVMPHKSRTGDMI